MQQIYPDEGLGNVTSKILSADFTMRLYVNNVDPDQDTTVADLVEAAWAGYAAVTLHHLLWSVPAVAGHVASSTYPAVSFLNSSGSPQSAYGYYIVDNLGNLFAVARFDAAPVTRPDAGTWVVIPIVGDFSTSL